MSSKDSKINGRNKKNDRVTILSIFSEPEFTKIEAIRIGERSGNESIYDKIVHTYCPKVKPLFNHYERRLPIKGFRPGTKIHRIKACERLVKFLKDTKQKHFATNWLLYRAGVIEFYRAEKEEIHKVLKEKITACDINEAAIHFIKKSTISSINKNEIEQFFDLFGFKDDENILSAITYLNDSHTELLFEIVNDVNKKTDLIEEHLEKNTDLVKDYINRIKSIETAVTLLNKNKQKSEPEKPSINTTKLLNDLSKDNKKNISDIKSIRRDTAALINELKEKIKSISVIDKKSLNDKVNSIEGSLETVKSSLNSKSKEIERIKDKTEGLVKLIKEFPATISKKNLIKHEFRKPKARKKSNKITNEKHFAAHYSLFLERKHNLILDRAQALIYHKIFLEMPVIILDENILFDAWISTLGWEENCISYVASPTWTSDEDWAGGAYSLLDKNEYPKFITIHNFDVALVECYLLPFLHKWSSSIESTSRSSLSKLVRANK